jgi:hypothetical protein
MLLFSFRGLRLGMVDLPTINYWLGKQHQFFGEWILLKFNAFVFLSVFLFAFPNHMELNEILKTDN